jgi:hypothetical protein
MSVRVFDAASPEDLEAAVTRWLGVHPTATITHISQSNHGVRIDLTVFYTEPPAEATTPAVLAQGSARRE